MNIYKKGVNRENCKDLVGPLGIEPETNGLEGHCAVLYTIGPVYVVRQVGVEPTCRSGRF